MSSQYDFHETDEQKQATRDVLDWWRQDCGWGRDLPERVIGTSPGALKCMILTLTPSPASKTPRYGHSTLKKCLVDGCETLIGSHQTRCKPCSKTRHYEQKKAERRKAWAERKGEIKLAGLSEHASVTLSEDSLKGFSEDEEAVAL